MNEKNMMKLFWCIIFIMVIPSISTASTVTDVSQDVYGRGINGLIAAFGDFNADKLTDVFLIKDSGKTVEILLADKVAPLLVSSSLVIKAEENALFTSVVPGDFDGDSKMDVLVTLVPEHHQTKNPPVNVSIYWGNLISIDGNPMKLEDQLRDQPLVMDYDADMIPDLYGEKSTGGRFHWIYRTRSKFVAEHIKNSTLHTHPLTFPHSCAFVDLNSDFTADLFVTTMDGDKYIFEVWYNMNGVLSFQYNYSFDASVHYDHVGQSSFADIDGDGNLEHILPVCGLAFCKDSAIYVFSFANLSWTPLVSEFNKGKEAWGFARPTERSTGGMTLRFGDFNLDGYPDAVTILQSEIDGELVQRAVLLLNVECSSSVSKCQPVGRTLEVQWDMNPLISIDRPVLVAFYDIYEDGVLDILVANHQSSEDKPAQLHALLNVLTEDACFLKVIVLSGMCRDCLPGYKVPYGVNQAGPVIKYDTRRPDGSLQTSRATQLSQSAHFALQLPYTVFGLGQTPNFVDTIRVGIPHPQGEDVRQHEWTTIIPNSQVIIIPHPNSNAEYWVIKLFVTPSELVLITGALLLGICGFIAGIIGVLHWREKVADRKERLQEAHRFHFDAM
ncbi:PREDICTED: T-cell immunomodulatory protein-like [Priapulus caudatus]|uniref:T-cell immunomodulatory protein-like n=1 Tax=Priapulus caudatus TaxID=37621 RepID=A0ABM1EDT5_PRICU|nr:PREDICTED: T-cell immunomodulatory protein-like [Priapulus caudatus]